jgi:hypothetical protein
LSLFLHGGGNVQRIALLLIIVLHIVSEDSAIAELQSIFSVAPPTILSLP